MNSNKELGLELELLFPVAKEIIDLANSYYEMAKNYHKNNDFVNAIEYFTKTINLIPSYADAWCGRGTVYLDLGKPENAIPNYNQAIALNPRKSAYFNNRGFAFAMIKQDAKAIVDYNKAMELNPDRDTMAGLYIDRGVSNFNLGNIEQAMSDCNEAIRLGPDIYRIWMNYGMTHSKLGNHEMAISSFTQCIRLEPNNPNGWNLRGSIYFELKYFVCVILDLNQAIKLDPDYIGYYGNRCNAYIQLGRISEAISDCIEVLKRDADNVDSSELLYCMLLDLKQSDLDGLKRKALFKAIKKFSLEKQKEIFRICLDENTVLGGHFVPVAEDQFVMFRTEDTMFDRRNIASYLDSIDPSFEFGKPGIARSPMQQ